MKSIISRTALTLLFATLIFNAIPAQTEEVSENRHIIEFPDIPGYVTLKCDLHMHTVLSDGSVWPNIRVQEALKDVMEVFREAKRQGAFVFWNHPHWTAQKHNLTLLGNSDIHGLVDWSYKVPEGGHRPVTLVFAKEKTEVAMQEAMEKRRTAVWFKNTLVGNQEFLAPLIEESLEVIRRGKGPVPALLIHNHSDADYILENLSDYTLHNFAPIFTLKAHETTTVMVKTLETLESFELKFRVLNAFTTPDKHPEINITVQ